jgi:hypothetical protein
MGLFFIAARRSWRATCIVPGSFLKDPEMNSTDISTLARQLFAAQGAKAIAEAAQKAETSRRAGDAELAKIWERVEGALREMRGPNQT